MSGQPAVDVPAAEPQLGTGARDRLPPVVPTAVSVESVEQGQSDAGVGRGLHQRVGHDCRAVRTVHVVELADRRVSGEQQFGIERGRERVVPLGVESLGHGVHRLAPGPEVAAVGVGAPTEGAVEGVRVRVRDAGEGEAAAVRRRRHRAGPSTIAVMTPSACSTRTPERTAPSTIACSSRNALMRPAPG